MTAREFIKDNEGKSYTVYQCTRHVNTIGIGHNCDANPLPKDIAAYLKNNGRILDEHVDRLFAIDLGHAVSDCKKLFPEYEKLSHERKIALVDFVFQLGKTKAMKFIHFIAAVNTGRWDDAIKELRDSDYYRQVPRRAERVINLMEVG